MNKLFKKIIVLLPVLALGLLHIKANYRGEYRHAGTKRLMLFLITLLLLYGWMMLVTWRRKQESAWQMLIQSSFFVYVFMVLTLTGYFILFRELTYHGWWERMLSRINRHDHVNLKLFEMFRIYKLTDKQVLGNFVMLLPLGIYLPLMYKRLQGFIPVLLLCFLVAVTIEVLQLATSFRSVDVDDVLLNTTGAVLGYMLFWLARLVSNSFNRPATAPM